VAAAARQGRPVVLVDRRHANMPADFVSLDNAGAIRLAAAHLVAAGWNELLFVTEPVAGVSSRQEREAAFRAFLADQPGVRGTCFESTAEDSAGLAAELGKLRARGTRPAVLSSNAVITLRVADAVARLGWRFGEEIGFVGVGRNRMGTPRGSGPQHHRPADRCAGPSRHGLPAGTAPRPGCATAADPAAGHAGRATFVGSSFG
jgi:LacI family kdg operon repressor